MSSSFSSTTVICYSTLLMQLVELPTLVLSWSAWTYLCCLKLATQPHLIAAKWSFILSSDLSLTTAQFTAVYYHIVSCTRWLTVHPSLFIFFFFSVETSIIRQWRPRRSHRINRLRHHGGDYLADYVISGMQVITELIKNHNAASIYIRQYSQFLSDRLQAAVKTRQHSANWVTS